MRAFINRARTHVRASCAHGATNARTVLQSARMINRRRSPRRFVSRNLSRAKRGRGINNSSAANGTEKRGRGEARPPRRPRSQIDAHSIALAILPAAALPPPPPARRSFLYNAKGNNHTGRILLIDATVCARRPITPVARVDFPEKTPRPRRAHTRDPPTRCCCCDAARARGGAESAREVERPQRRVATALSARTPCGARALTLALADVGVCAPPRPY